MSSETLDDPQIVGLIDRARNLRLPDNHAVRWHESRKALVVEAVESGTLRLERALVLYRMSPEEFGTWREAWMSKRQWATASTSRRAEALNFGRKAIGQHPLPSEA
jgi:hypothetical protein